MSIKPSLTLNAWGDFFVQRALFSSYKQETDKSAIISLFWLPEVILTSINSANSDYMYLGPDENLNVFPAYWKLIPTKICLDLISGGFWCLE